MRFDENTKPCVIIESPYAAEDTAGRIRNVSYLEAAIRDSLDRGEAPFASHGFYVHYLNDNILEERLQGLECNLSWMKHADLVAVYTDLGISRGMHYGMDFANRNNIRIEYRSINDLTGGSW